MKRWRLMVDTLRARPLPLLPAIPGRVHRARDEAIAPELLEGITDPRELGLVLGIGTKAAAERLAGGGVSISTAAERKPDASRFSRIRKTHDDRATT